jgi:glutamate dehydrogenase
VLLSYAKIALQHELLESPLPDEPDLEFWLTGYFPTLLRERFAGDIERHSLRREIIALGLTNAIVNRGGPAMAVRLADETRRTSTDVARAFFAAREVFELPALWQRIDLLDGRVNGEAQLALYQATRDLVNAQTLWFLRDGAALSDLAGTIARHRGAMAALRPALAGVLPARRKAQLEQEVRRLQDGAVPADLAADIAALDVLGLTPRVAVIAEETGAAVADATRTYLAIGEHLHIADLAAKAWAIPTPDYYDRLAVAQVLGQLDAALAAFTREVLRADAGGIDTWLAGRGARLDRVRATLDEIAGEAACTVSRLLVAAGQLSDLAAAGPAVPLTSAKTARAAVRARSAASETPPARKPARRPRS